MNKRTLNIDEAATALGVSRRSIYNYIRAGLLLVEASPEIVNRHGEPGPVGGWRVLTTSIMALQYDRQVEREMRAAAKASRS